MPRTSLLCALGVVFSLAGCDSSDSGDVCADLGENPNGRLTARIDGDRFEANCFDVNTFNNDLVVVARRVSREGFEIDDQGSIELDIDDSRIGTSSIPDQAEAEYTSRAGSRVEATSGEVTLDEFSANRVVGSFTFTTQNGVEVTSGTFDINL